MTENEAKVLVYAAQCNGYTVLAQRSEDVEVSDRDGWEIYFPGRAADYLTTQSTHEALEGFETAFGIQVCKDAKLALRLFRLGLLNTKVF